MENGIDALVSDAYAAEEPVSSARLLAVPAVGELFRRHGVRVPADVDAVMLRFGSHLEERDEAREPNTEQPRKPFDRQQRALAVHRLLTYDPVDRAAGDSLERRRRAATSLRSAPAGNHSRQPIRSPAEFGKAFLEELSLWLGTQSDLQPLLLADLLAPSRIEHDASPESFEDLEAFVDGDPVVARLVAAGLHHPDSPTFDTASTRLRERATAWRLSTEAAGEELPGTPETQAAMDWLSGMLSDDENLLILAFLSFPEGLLMPLDLLAENDADMPLELTLARLSRMGLIEEARPERYRLPLDLHRRCSPIVQRVHWEDGIGEIIAPIVDYYEPRLRAVMNTFELHRFRESATYRRRAGYHSDSTPPISIDSATAWWEAEHDNVFQLIGWLQADCEKIQTETQDDLGAIVDALALVARLIFPATRALRAYAIEDPTELLAWIESQADDARFKSRDALLAIERAEEVAREFDAMVANTIAEMKAELAADPEGDRAEELRQAIRKWE